MSLNFDHNSNLFLVKSFHTKKFVSFILTVPAFFSTNCTQLKYYCSKTHTAKKLNNLSLTRKSNVNELYQSTKFT
jgi:hypothetical protein